MDMHLMRCDSEQSGIFSDLRDMTGNRHAVTLEHAFKQDDGSYAPIIPNGTFTCVRGQHHLESMPKGQTFETFEVTGVPGHSGLVFHWGNWNRNSKGCPLTGEYFYDDPKTPEHIDMVANSRAAFTEFMKLQQGCDTFKLTVS